MELLNTLNQKQKKAYQVFRVAHGIETFEVKVPLPQAEAFQRAFTELPQKDKRSILEAVIKHGGQECRSIQRGAL